MLSFVNVKSSSVSRGIETNLTIVTDHNETKVGGKASPWGKCHASQ